MDTNELAQGLAELARTNPEAFAAIAPAVGALQPKRPDPREPGRATKVRIWTKDGDEKLVWTVDVPGWLAAGATREPPGSGKPPKKRRTVAPPDDERLAALRSKWLAKNPGKQPPPAAKAGWFERELSEG